MDHDGQRVFLIQAVQIEAPIIYAIIQKYTVQLLLLLSPNRLICLHRVSDRQFDPEPFHTGCTPGRCGRRYLRCDSRLNGRFLSCKHVRLVWCRQGAVQSDSPGRDRSLGAGSAAGAKEIAW